MEERKSIRHIPPIVHEGCGGVFNFSKEMVFGERICTGCGRKETYELNLAVIVGKPGITQNNLRNFCQSAGLTLRETHTDKSNSNVLAVVVFVPNEILRDHLDSFELWMDAVEKKQGAIFTIFRKPVALDKDRMGIPYIEKRG